MCPQITQIAQMKVLGAHRRDAMPYRLSAIGYRLLH